MTNMIVQQSRSNGMKAGAALFVTALAGIYVWGMLWLPGLGYTGYLTYKWLMYRGKYGMKF
jgi:hypothetical protein